MRDDDVSDDVAAAASAVAPPPSKLDNIDPILSLSLSLSLSVSFIFLSLKLGGQSNPNRLVRTLRGCLTQLFEKVHDEKVKFC